jgi:hypothetical protein
MRKKKQTFSVASSPSTASGLGNLVSDELFALSPLVLQDNISPGE